MKNKIFGLSIIISIIILFNTLLHAENIFIESKNISLDKNKKISIFENEVIIKTKENSTIKSEYAEYNKNNGLIKLKDKITIIDKENNKVETNYAEYNEKTKIFKSIGPTKIITSENYIVNTEDVTFDNYKNFISSKKNTSITDLDNNKIYLENFDFLTKQNIFKSIGFIRLEDNNKNSYEFSQIYIDTKKKEILGTDIKAFMNSDDFKTSPKNKPRVFANTINVNKESNVFNKSIFTLCDYRKNDKCPPWSIQSTKMLHDRKKKKPYIMIMQLSKFMIFLFFIFLNYHILIQR